MKILYLRTLYWFGLKAGGSVGHTAGVINALDKKVDLKVISNDELSGVTKQIQIVSPVRVPFLTKDMNELLFNIKIIKRFKECEFGAIYQRYNGFSFCGAYLASKFNVSFVLEFNSSDVWKIKNWKSDKKGLGGLFKKIYAAVFKAPVVSFLENYNLKNATHIVVVSQALKQILLGFGVDEAKILVNPNGIDPNLYNNRVECEDIKQRYELNGRVALGFIGTFGQWHGAENIVLAYNELLKNDPSYKEKTKLLLVGDGVKMPQIKELVAKFKLCQNVVLTGLVPQNEGARHLNACDILINSTVPNPDGSEFFGSPTKLFEYMAMQKAIICSDMAQMSQILQHGKTAYMVKPGDIKQMCAAMKTLVDDKNLRANLGRNAASEALQKYTWDKHVEKILEKIGE